MEAKSLISIAIMTKIRFFKDPDRIVKLEKGEVSENTKRE